MITSDTPRTDSADPLPSRRYICVGCGGKGRRANKPEQRLQDPICPRCKANCADLDRLMEWQAACLERNPKNPLFTK